MQFQLDLQLRPGSLLSMNNLLSKVHNDDFKLWPAQSPCPSPNDTTLRKWSCFLYLRLTPSWALNPFSPASSAISVCQVCSLCYCFSLIFAGSFPQGLGKSHHLKDKSSWVLCPLLAIFLSLHSQCFKDLTILAIPSACLPAAHRHCNLVAAQHPTLNWNQHDSYI